MANEASVQAGLQISSGHLRYRTPLSTFRATVTGAKGPTPGAVTVSVSGTDIDLSGLVNPGLCYVKNISSDYTIVLGPRDPDTGVFLPVWKLLPGEGYPMRLSGELLGSEVTGTGTGAGNATLRARAVGGSAVLQFDAFEE